MQQTRQRFKNKNQRRPRQGKKRTTGATPRRPAEQRGSSQKRPVLCPFSGRPGRQQPNQPVCNRVQLLDKLSLSIDALCRRAEFEGETGRRMLPQELVRSLQVHQQLALDIRGFTDINPLASIRQAVNARSMRRIVPDRSVGKRAISVRFKRHYWGLSLGGALCESKADYCDTRFGGRNSLSNSSRGLLFFGLSVIRCIVCSCSGVSSGRLRGSSFCCIWFAFFAV
jgi:hypothetical protein